MNVSLNKHFSLHIAPFCLAAALAAAGCDGHHEVYEPAVVGQVLCTDGHVRTYDDMVAEGKKPIAVVFHSLAEADDDGGSAYAVYLYDLPAAQFADTIGTSQGTSADITAYDGRENTYAIMSQTNVSSQLADAVWSVWAYNQSAYIGSVAQMRLLFARKEDIAGVISKCGGDALPDAADECWYWSSTEVEGAEDGQAWLVSMESGTIHETPKTVQAKLRPMVTVYSYE